MTDEQKFRQFQKSAAEAKGLAITTQTSPEAPFETANDNSICRVFLSDEKYAVRCAEFCGKAFDFAAQLPEKRFYVCHAGLFCTAQPLKNDGESKSEFVAIVGRAFAAANDYRDFTQKVWRGDYDDIEKSDWDANILIASREEIESCAEKFVSANETKDFLNLQNVCKVLPDVIEADEKTAENSAEDLRHFDEQPQKPEIQSEEPPRKMETQSEEPPENALPTPENLPAEIAAPDGKHNLAELMKQWREKQNAALEPLDQPIAFNNKNGKIPLAPQLKLATAITRKEQSSGDGAPLENIEKSAQKTTEKTTTVANVPNEGQLLIAKIFNKDFREACRTAAEWILQKYDLSSVAWLERRENALEMLLAVGSFAGRNVRIKLDVSDQRLLKIIERETSFQIGQKNQDSRVVELFPLAVGAEIKGALVIDGNLPNEETRREISRFSRRVAMPLEVLRLREELRTKDDSKDSLREFSESIQTADTENIEQVIVAATAKLLKARKTSLLVFDESTGKLSVRAAIGANAAISGELHVGDRVAQKVFSAGRPLIGDLSRAGIAPAPVERGYRTDSFISYPIRFGNRKLAVFNATDKISGDSYGENDLALLDAVAPQMAIALDREQLKKQSDELEQKSITDSLTGLFNRSYIEARLGEEFKRSQRHGYPMSFVMIDVDDFKSYNDSFGHIEGDQALKITADCLRNGLRAADVAARFGGEEFCILLPQTTLSEAKTIAERIRKRVEATAYPKRNVTVSIGIAGFANNRTTPDQIIHAADIALYKAKSAGKNNVQTVTD